MKNGSTRLDGKKVAVLAADGFEYVELTIPKKALKWAGASVDVVSLEEGKIRGMNLTEPTKRVRVDCTLENADPRDYDALFIPGGFVSPDFLRQSRAAREFVRAMDQARKPIAALCHGPWVLVSAELVRGRRLASWPSVRDDIVHAGGIWRDEPVVRDGNWISSRGPQDLSLFVPAMIEHFAGEEAAAEAGPVEMESSPQYDAPNLMALEAARRLPPPSVVALAGMAVGTAIGAQAARR